MFRKSISILLIITCIISQYAKQFGYLQCKFENFTNQAPTCDCEKKYDTGLSKDDNSLPLQKSHIHVSVDEYYVPAENNFDIYTTYQSRKLSQHPVLFIDAYCGNIFHPPQFS